MGTDGKEKIEGKTGLERDITLAEIIQQAKIIRLFQRGSITSKY